MRCMCNLLLEGHNVNGMCMRSDVLLKLWLADSGCQWLHGVGVSACWFEFVSPECGFSLSLFCNRHF